MLSNPTWWQAIIECAVFVAGVVNFFSAAFFWRARATFASKSDLSALEGKIEELLESAEKKVDTMDTRLRVVEVSYGMIEGEIRGIRDLCSRTDHMVQLLVEYRIRETAHA
jgi:hypothetical protein